MLTLSDANLSPFLKASREQFAWELVRHFQSFAPELSQIVGEPSLHEYVRAGIGNALRHGLTLRGPVRFFLELAFTFGTSFDTDPQLPWAAQILGDVGLDEVQRARCLFAASQEFLLDTAGPADIHACAALRRVRAIASTPFTPQGSSYEARVASSLREVYPEKFRVIGPEVVRTLASRGLDAANEHGLIGEAPALLLTALAYGFGHGILSDPLYPWIGRTLARKSGSQTDTRANRLARKVIIYVDHMLMRLDSKGRDAVSRQLLSSLVE